MPQSRKVSPSLACKGFSALSPSTLAQEVPPAPATSIAAIPASISLTAITPEIPFPTSLAMIGTGNLAASWLIFSNKLRKFVSPLGWIHSCSGLICRIKASASRISTSLRH